VTDLLNVSKAREDELGDNAFIIGVVVVVVVVVVYNHIFLYWS